MDSLVKTLMNAWMIHITVMQMPPALILKDPSCVSVTLDSPLWIMEHCVQTLMNVLMVHIPAILMPTALIMKDHIIVNVTLDSQEMDSIAVTSIINVTNVLNKPHMQILKVPTTVPALLDSL